METTGPCTPFTGVEAYDNQAPGPVTDPSTGFPFHDLWGMQNTQAPSTPAGVAWMHAGGGCDGTTTISDLSPGTDSSGQYGCTVNLIQNGCSGEPASWSDSDGSALGCPRYDAGTAATAPGCLTLSAGSSADDPTVVAVPSATISLPVACTFHWGVRGRNPSYPYGDKNYASPWDGTYPRTSGYMTQWWGNNEVQPDQPWPQYSYWGEGDSMSCTVKAQVNTAPQGAPAVWTDIPNSKTLLNENQAVSLADANSGGGEKAYTQNGTLTVPLPGADTEIRLNYSYAVRPESERRLGYERPERLADRFDVLRGGALHQ